jgi:hypothetical protein
MRTVDTFFSNENNIKQVWRSMNLEDTRLTLADKMSALDIMDCILALKEETKLEVVILLWR